MFICLVVKPEIAKFAHHDVEEEAGVGANSKSFKNKVSIFNNCSCENMNKYSSVQYIFTIITRNHSSRTPGINL